MWDLCKQFNPHIPCQSTGNLLFFVLKIVCRPFLVGPLHASISCSESNLQGFLTLLLWYSQSLFGDPICSRTNHMLDRLGGLGPVTVFLLRSSWMGGIFPAFNQSCSRRMFFLGGMALWPLAHRKKIRSEDVSYLSSQVHAERLKVSHCCFLAELRTPATEERSKALKSGLVEVTQEASQI